MCTFSRPGVHTAPRVQTLRAFRARATNLPLCLLACFLLFPAITSAQPKPVKRVLVFYELGLSSPAVSLADQQLRSVLENSPYQIELYREYLETTLFPDPATQQEFRDWYIHKYRDRRPDLIIALGPSPLTFLADSHGKSFKDTPVVFGGTAEEEVDNLKLDAHFTGVWEKLEPEKTLEAALRLQPGTKHVVVVGGMSSFDRHIEAIFKKNLHSYEGKLDVTYLTNLSMPALLDGLKDLPAYTIVLNTHIGMDAQGSRYVGASQADPMLVNASNSPVFGPSDVDLGHGEVGGYLDSFAVEGRLVGAMAVRILKGEQPQNIPVVRGANTYIFDWSALHRWGFKESDLPRGSVVLNREPTFWELYRRYILAGIFVLLTQTGIIVALLWEWKRREKAQEALALSNERLRLAMETAKAVSWHTDFTRGLTTWSGGLHGIFGIPSDTISTQPGEFLHYVQPEDRQRVSECLSHAREHHEPCAVEFRMVRPDGVTRWVSARGRFDYQTNGNATRMLGMAVDITERKLSEEALRKSEEKFSKIFRESPLAITLTSLKDDRYIDVNETFERLTGWTRDEVIGRTTLEIDIWVDPGERAQFLERLLAEDHVRNLETSLRTKDRQVRIGLRSAELIELNGEPCALTVVADLTDLKRAEEAERIAEQRFRQFFETLPEYCHMVSPAGEILDVNPAVCQTLGYSKEELIGRHLSILYGPEEYLKATARLQKWVQTGSLHNEETVMLTKDGKKRTFLLNAGAVRDAQGNILHSASVYVDITDHKEVQQKLRESQNRLESIVASAMDAIIATDSEHRIVVFNAAAEAMFGCPAQEAILTSIDRFIPERFRSAHKEHMRRFATTGAFHRVTGILGLTANGEEFPIETSISQVDTDGERLFIVIIRDITERKRVEEAVHESEQRFRLVANTAPVMIWTSGPDKLCDYFNQPWLEFTGRSLESELGNGWAAGVHTEDLERCLNTYRTAFDRRESFQMEYRFRRHAGEYRWLHGMGVPRFNADGSFAGYIGSCIDVTERREAEDALSTVSRRLIEAHEEERSWLARELHDDINQRLAVLAVTLDVVKRDLPDAATEARRSILEIREQVTDLGNDVQALSHRLHSSKLEYLGLVAAASAFCRELSERQEVQIDFQCEAVPKALPKEISLCLFRVLQEALQNAAKHSGSQHFQVSIACTVDKINLTVRDSGSGFNAEEAMKGRGLGIVSMRERVKLVDGELSIDSQVEKGTEVRASVPLNACSKSAGAGKT
jgi:PAS domain S-box-containing protein